MRAAQVRQRQAAEHLAVVQLLRREGHRHREDHAVDAVGRRRLPEGRAAAHGGDLRLLRRDEAPQELRRLPAHHVQVGHVRHETARRIVLEVADQEVVDAVLARVDARREARPRRRRLRGLRRLEPREGALVRERLEVRQLALVHPLAGERRVHPVEAEHEDALLRPAQRLAAGQLVPAVGEGEGEDEGGEGGGGEGEPAEERGLLQGHSSFVSLGRPVYPRRSVRR